MPYRSRIFFFLQNIRQKTLYTHDHYPSKSLCAQRRTTHSSFLRNIIQSHPDHVVAPTYARSHQKRRMVVRARFLNTATQRYVKLL